MNGRWMFENKYQVSSYTREELNTGRVRLTFLGKLPEEVPTTWSKRDVQIHYYQKPDVVLMDGYGSGYRRFAIDVLQNAVLVSVGQHPECEKYTIIEFTFDGWMHQLINGSDENVPLAEMERK